MVRGECEMERVFQLLSAIESTSSSKQKQELLKSGENLSNLSKLLYRTYNPYMMYYMKKIPEVSPKSVRTSDDRFDEFCSVLDLLTNRAVTGNNALELMSKFLSTCNKAEIFWYTKVIQKNLLIGITEKTINKVYTGLIPVFDCMLAEPLKSMKDLPEEYYIEPKLDGLRVLGTVNIDGSTVLKTRNGNQIFGFEKLEQEMSEFLPRGFVYDGEITGTSFNTIMMAAFKKAKGKTGILNIFDVVPIKEWENQQSIKTQIERKSQLIDIFTEIEDYSTFSLVPHKGIFKASSEIDVAATDKLYQSWVNLGYEGIMIKNANIPYQFKRTTQLLKLKPFKTFDLPVVGVEQGTGQFEGILGAVIVKYGEYEVRVGSGFTNAQRIEYWNNPSSIVGKLIEVWAQEETTNKKGTNSLRFPTFKCIREDKQA